MATSLARLGRWLMPVALAAGWTLLSACQKTKDDPAALVAPIAFEQPGHFPPPVYDLAANPVTPAGFELGRALFYDPALSRDNTVSCGFCHLQTAGFTQHGHALSHGINGELTERNSMPIQNLAWEKSFTWDGGVDQLDRFPPVPIQNPHEMGETLPNVLGKLRRRAGYRAAFARAFGDSAITTDRFFKALSQFQLMCVSASSKYDRVLTNQPGYAFTETEETGRLLFEAKCASCHAGVLFTDGAFRSNGLPIYNRADSGRQRITQRPQDRYRFKTPSLRNVALTGPYMHDGRFLTLQAVLDHYASGVADADYTDPSLLPAGQAPGIPLTSAEKAGLIAFLLTLTDTTLITNPRLAAPANLP